MRSLLFDAELFRLTPRLNLERCQSWFLKHIFYVPSFTPGPFLLNMPGLYSVAFEIVIEKLLFLGRLITESIWLCQLEIGFNVES